MSATTFAIGRQPASAWFPAVLPDETADTPSAALIPWTDVAAWKPPLPLPTLVSPLAEIPWPEYVSASGEVRNVTFTSWACKDRGNEAERVFAELAAARGWRAKNTAERAIYNYRHHVDFMFVLPPPPSKDSLLLDDSAECARNEVWVDVKSARALRRGWRPQSEYMTVELHTSGWLMDGKATVIALEMQPRKFCLFDRAALADYVRTVVRVDLPVVPYPEQSYHRVYIRESEGARGARFTSVLSMVRTKDAYAAAGCGFMLE
jgi:hypothetical protein